LAPVSHEAIARLDGEADCPHPAVMTDVSPALEPLPPRDDSRSLAMLNYGLLFCSIFFAGVPALIAVAMAYAQKSKAPPLLRSHYRFQIGLFWSGFLLALIAGALFVTGLVTAIFEFLADTGADWTDGVPMLRELRAHGPALLMIIGGMLIAALDALWLVAASAFGFIRLASHQGLSKSAA
jgi:uncharacterized membrane protein